MAALVYSLVLSVAADVIAYYIVRGFQRLGETIRRWLARKGKGK